MISFGERCYSNQYDEISDDEFSDDEISGFANTTKFLTTNFLTTKFPPPLQNIQQQRIRFVVKKRLSSDFASCMICHRINAIQV